MQALERAPQRHAEAIQRGILSSDFYSFVQASFPIISGGARLDRNWHLEAMAAALESVRTGHCRRLIITIPPRSLKSICASVAFPAFVLGRDPARKIICVSYADSLARKHANDCRALMRSPLYQFVFPATRIGVGKDAEQETMTSARGFRLATSVGGTLTGRGGDMIIIDDPLKPQDAMSEVARENVKQWYSNTLLSRLDHKRDGAIIIVMQRLHCDDLVGHVMEQGGWQQLNLPAIAEEPMQIPLGNGRAYNRNVGELLHPSREDKPTLDQLRDAMGSMAFSAQYQQSPVPTEGNLIKWSWFKFFDSAPQPDKYDKLIVSWDTAMSANQLSDFSACVVLLVKGGSMYVLDVIRARMEYPELRRAVIASHQRWSGTTHRYALVIENKGSGQSLLQDLRSQRIHAISMEPEGDKILRMSAQTAPIEAGAIHLPKSAPWLETFKQELLAFPAGRHDDQVDAFSQALKRATQLLVARPQFGTYGA